MCAAATVPHPWLEDFELRITYIIVNGTMENSKREIIMMYVTAPLFPLTISRGMPGKNFKCTIYGLMEF